MKTNLIRYVLTLTSAIMLSSCLQVDEATQDQAPSSSTGSLLKPIAASFNRSCAISTSGKLKCWGMNDHGQLGLGDTAHRGDDSGEMGTNLPYVNLGTGRTVKAVAMGDKYNCALLDNDKVKCWGENANGQLGYGDTVDRGDNSGEMGDNLPYVDLGTGITPKTITASGDHTCVIFTNSKLKCWGYNNDGELGYEDQNNRGDNSGEMGDNLPYVDAGTGRTFKVVEAATHHTCAILDNDKMKCWGHNGFGQLGQGDTNGRGHYSGSMGDSLGYIDLGTGRTAKAIMTGDFSNCALLDNSKLKCWGRNHHGQAGQGHANDIGGNAGEMGDNLAYVNVGTGLTVKAVTSMFDHACAILSNDKVKCWGYNNSGQLGLGDTTNRGDTSGQMGDSLAYVDLGAVGGVKVSGLAGGHTHSCAYFTNDKFKCWGNGWPGVLGAGNNDPLGAQAGEMGTSLAYIDLGF